MAQPRWPTARAKPRKSRSNPHRRLGFLALIAAVAIAFSMGSTVRAQAPTDVAAWQESPADRLPEPPDGFLTERRGPVQWVFPASATSLVRDLQSGYQATWREVTAPLGGTIEDTLEIRIGVNPSEMAALAPESAPPPGYAVGVAYPARGLVLLSLTAPETWEFPDLERVLTHELSHIALFRAVRGRSVPRWFVEGLAITQAGENDLTRVRTLWTATLSDQLLPLEALSGAFPSRPYAVNVAYAQSADLVDFLLSQKYGARSFRALLKSLREGSRFEDSVLASYHESLPSVERRWRRRLEERFSTLPLIFSGTGVWLLATLLLVAAYVRRRRRHRSEIARMAEEESAQARMFARVEQTVERKLGTDAEGEAVVYVPISSGDLDVPTVEYEGQNHTLH